MKSVVLWSSYELLKLCDSMLSSYELSHSVIAHHKSVSLKT